jgi:glucosamine 6-phosphate synthetase-like amidotransferase/phosphosugar isomerase protein
MCGILGVCLNKDHGLKDKKNELSDFIKELFIETSARGRVSTGIAAITDKKALFMKGKLSGREFVNSSHYDAFIDEAMLLNTSAAERLYSIIGHCRLDTKGTPVINDNNHPIITDNMIGIHNGNISNDEELYTRFKNRGIKRKGTVDSEVIFQIIDMIYKEKAQTSVNCHTVINAIKDTARDLKGSFVCAMLNKKEPSRIYLFRNSAVMLDVLFFKEYGMTVFCSNRIYIKTAFEKTFGKTINSKSFYSDSVEEFMTKPYSVRAIDLNTKFTKLDTFESEAANAWCS